MEQSTWDSQSPLPGSAPPFVWTVIFLAIAVWWLWPTLELFSKKLSQPKAVVAPVVTPSRPPAPPVAVEAAAPAARKVADAPAKTEGSSQPSQQLSLELEAAFDGTYAEASRLIAAALAVPPTGKPYQAAMTAMHCLISVIDKMFLAWGDPEELARVTRIKEDGQAFAKSFAVYKEGSPAHGLLALAGFRRCDAKEGEGCKKVWAFDREDHLSRLQAMAVKLCLQRLSELQRLRGTMRWVQKSNEAVIPKPGDGSLLEVLDLYRTEPLRAALNEKNSLRERNLEAQVRAKLHERRQAAGFSLPLGHHEGLAGVARVLAQAQRTQVRQNRGDLPDLPPPDTKIQELLAQLPLPPGLEAANLFWSSDELPKLFGLASTTGKGGSSAGGRHDGPVDAAAEILAREAVGHWAAKQAADVTWPFAAICGVGAALDYTINRGFVVTLLAGFEGLTPEDNASLSKRREQAAADRRAAQAPPPEQKAAGGWPGGGGALFGARVRTLTNSSADVPLHKK